MGIIRVHKRENPYVIIDKTGINDVRLSWKARGLLCYLLSKPNDWKINVKHLTGQGPDGERATRSGLKELEKLGYMVTKPVRDDKGRITEWEHNIFEVPDDDDCPDCQNVNLDNPDVQNVDVDNVHVGNQHLDNAVLLNNEYILNNESPSNDFNNISQSVSQSCHEEEIGKRNDGPTGRQKEMNDFNKILERCQLGYLDTPEAVRGALEDMYFAGSFADRAGVPLEIVRGRMRKLNLNIIEYAVFKMERAAADGTGIRNSMRYLQACIYNAITEYESDIIADEFLARLKAARRKPDKAEGG